jgi:Cu+-exporting ATPase
MSATDLGDDPTGRLVDLEIGGMTCASCAARIEKRLNRLDGVEATVNYATERAAVTVAGDVTDTSLIAQVEGLGYRAAVPAPVQPGSAPKNPRDTEGSAGQNDEADLDAAVLLQRLLVSAALGLPVLVLSMIPALQFDNWQWLAFALTGPVVVWGAWPFHRAAAMNARHGAASMDTLVSLGTIAAFGWSVYALFWGDAGHVGMTMELTFGVDRGAGHSELYLEVASAVTVFLLAGRYFEAKAKRRSGAALRALLDLLHHRIGSTHVAHHIDHRIPHYRAQRATDAIREAFPEWYRFDPTPIPVALWRVGRDCVAVAESGDGWRFAPEVTGVGNLS